jgi:transcription termination factor Rho
VSNSNRRSKNVHHRGNSAARPNPGNQGRRGDHGNRQRHRKQANQGPGDQNRYRAEAQPQRPVVASPNEVVSPAVLTGASGPEVEGWLHAVDSRDGVLRDPQNPLRPVNGGIIVSKQMMSDLRLRTGLSLRGLVKGRHLVRITSVEGQDPNNWAERTTLYDSTALDPQPQIKLEHNPLEFTTRIIDILAPVGFGQRGLIVAPPRTGKTILMQNIARGIHANHPQVQLVLLLVDERPEEVTDMRRNVPGTVYASSNDNTVEKHLDLAQLVIERCKRQVEMGVDIVVLMDSLTRVGRAFNTGGPSGGRTMSGGLDNRALEIPKRLFGAARKIENGGSLTIMATCLIDTGSRMDQVIFEEFKGTGNMELTLDRDLANQRIFPALNIPQSGTRKEEKLLGERELATAQSIRRHLTNMSPVQGMKTMLDVMAKHKTNRELFDSMRVR